MTTIPTTTEMMRFLIAISLLCATSAFGQAVTVADDEIYVRRFADTVVVRRAADGSERVLYSNTAATRIGVGDEVQQGSSGRTDWVLPGGGVATMRGATHGIVKGLGGKRDIFTFLHASQLTLTSLARPLTVRLGDSALIAFAGTTVKITREDGRYLIRNEGDTVVVVTSDLVHQRQTSADISAKPDPKIVRDDGPGRVKLGVGQEVRVMIRPRSTIGTQQQLWGEVTVRHDGDVDLLTEGDVLLVQPSTEQPGDVSVGGVTLTVSPNDALLVRRVRPRPAGLKAPSATTSAAGEDINTEMKQ